MTDVIINDTTLRDGQQNAEATMSAKRKVEMFGKLDEMGVPYVEVAWPASPREDPAVFDMCRRVRKQARIVAFGSTSIKPDPKKDQNLECLVKSAESGADVLCIFGKTWKTHVSGQLGISPGDNLKKIEDSLAHLRKQTSSRGTELLYDGEHFFDGYNDDSEYAIETLAAAVKGGAKRLILCDTNGGTLPHEAERIVKETKEKLKAKSIDTPLGVHFHDDAGVSVANALMTAPYAEMVQGTANGMGERVGNLNWPTFAAAWVWKMGNRLSQNLNWQMMREVSNAASTLSGLPVDRSTPYIGSYAFAHKGGIHVNATVKDQGASYEHINPGLFGNVRRLLLTSQGGRDSLIWVARQFGKEFDKHDPYFVKQADLLFKRLAQMEDEGYRVAAIKAEHFLLVEEFLGNLREFFRVGDWRVETGFKGGKEQSSASVHCEIDGKVRVGAEKIHGGPVHALYNSLVGALASDFPELKRLKIDDYAVDLAHHLGVRSPVRNYIRFTDGQTAPFATVGVSDNVLRSSKQAMEKSLRYYLNVSRPYEKN